MRIRLGLLLASLVISAGCAHGPCRCDKPAEVAKPAVSFAEVRAWGPLTWDMTMPQARAALDAAHIYYIVPNEEGAARESGEEESQGSRYLYGKRVERDYDAEPYVQPVANRTIQLELAKGWVGTITFGPGPQGQILAIVLQSGLLDDEAAAVAVLAERATIYGAPTSIGSASGTTKQQAWQNSTTQLLVTVWLDQSTNKWRAYEQWTRLGA